MMTERARPAADTRTLRLRRAARPTALHGLRRQVEQWANHNELPAAVVVDLQLALGEAVANAVEHAYGPEDAGEVEVEVEIVAPGQRRGVLAVRVTDEGRWRPAPSARGNRGHGLTMIKMLAQDVRVWATARGTHVRFEIPLAEA